MKRNYKYALSDHEGSSHKATPNGEAWAVARNKKTRINTSQTYVHLVIDDDNIYQVGEVGYDAWG